METATLGGGCYWCLEAVFQRIRGIKSIVSGYSGGTVPKPTIDQVYYENTGHAEVVQVTFDPKQISYQEILGIFFTMHDPTTLNQQDYDIGDEYRSIIFYHSPEQQKTAREMIDTFATDLWSNPVVTELVPYQAFWKADESAQDYYNRNPDASYCRIIIDPKVQKLRQKFASRLKSDV